MAIGGEEVKDKTLEEKIAIVKQNADKLQTTILLKGKEDIIAGFDKQEISVSETGCPTMAVGGTGDALAGIAGALLARGIDCHTAGTAAAYLNGMAGQASAKKFGDSMLATDLIESIPSVLMKL